MKTSSSASLTALIPAQRGGASSKYIDFLFDDDYFDERLKERIEAIAMNLFLEQHLRVGDTLDDPFDGIYLSHLSPDPISEATRKQLASHDHIIDKSDEISFNDDLEDD